MSPLEEKSVLKASETGGLVGTVDLKITGGQGEITTRTRAQSYYRNQSHYLLFEENIAEDGKKGSMTFQSRLKINEKQITLRRSLPHSGSGTAPVMEFVYRLQEEGERGCMIEYPTPYGKMLFEICTEELSVSREENRLVANIRYRMLQEGQEVSRDRLRIEAVLCE